jgi:hypothetical protein
MPVSFRSFGGSGVDGGRLQRARDARVPLDSGDDGAGPLLGPALGRPADRGVDAHGDRVLAVDAAGASHFVDVRWPTSMFPLPRDQRWAAVRAEGVAVRVEVAAEVGMGPSRRAVGPLRSGRRGDPVSGVHGCRVANGRSSQAAPTLPRDRLNLVGQHAGRIRSRVGCQIRVRSSSMPVLGWPR